MIKEGTLPKTAIFNEQALNYALKILTNFEYFGNKENYTTLVDGEFQYSSFILYYEALLELLYSDTGTIVQGIKVSKEGVYERLARYIAKDKEGIPRIIDLKENTLSDYSKAVCEKEIKNPLSYMKACIWNSLRIGNAKIEAEIKLFEGE